ncbi:MAG: polysaccharide deacetylase family protein [Bacteriovorax sp.]
MLISFSASASIKMAITIDDLPVHGPLPAGMSRADIAKKMLSVLKKEKIPEVYGFINANKAELQPDSKQVLKLWVNSGYPLGNHTYTHMSLNKYSSSDFERDIKANESMLAELNAKMNWHYFRYPYLQEGDTLEKRNDIRKYLSQNAYEIAQVSVDFEDWSWNEPYTRCLAKKDTKAIKWLESTYMQNALGKLEETRKITNALFKRDISHILLLHIGAFDAKMLPALIKKYKAQGVEFISLSEALKDDVYKTDPGVAAKRGSEIQIQMMNSRNITMKDLGIEQVVVYPQKELESLCH